MTRRKGERTTTMNERDFPFVVRLPVPEGRGFMRTLDQITAWHAQHGLIEHRGRAARTADRWYESWCFANAAWAMAFHKAFGATGPEES